jgi:hypothetical protein
MICQENFAQLKGVPHVTFMVFISTLQIDLIRRDATDKYLQFFLFFSVCGKKLLKGM